jgi:hypothetical protein
VPADKDAARRRRQARNRQERLNRQTRVEGAKRSAATRPSRTADRPVDKGGATARSTATTGAGGFLDKLFPPRPEPAKRGQEGRPARRPPTKSTVVEVDSDATGLRGLILRWAAQPGGRATMFAVVIALASAALLLFVPIAPRVVLEYYGETVIEASHDDPDIVSTRQEEFAEDDPVYTTDLLVNFASPLAVGLATVIPVAITGFALSGLTKPTRSRTLLIAAGIAALYSLLGSTSLFLVGAIALGFAAYQSRKADTLAAAAEASDVGDDAEDGDQE